VDAQITGTKQVHTNITDYSFASDPTKQHHLFLANGYFRHLDHKTVIESWKIELEKDEEN